MHSTTALIYEDLWQKCCDTRAQIDLPDQAPSDLSECTLPPSPCLFALSSSLRGWKPFFEITQEDVQSTLDISIGAAFTFSREVLLRFTKNETEQGKRGTLIFTGATASLRGNVTTSAFAAGKFAIRGLSQALAKEFSKQDIHVAHSIIDGDLKIPPSTHLRARPSTRLGRVKVRAETTTPLIIR